MFIDTMRFRPTLCFSRRMRMPFFWTWPPLEYMCSDCEHILGVSNLVKSYNLGMHSLPFLLNPSWCCLRLDVYSAWRHLLYSWRDLEPLNYSFWWIKGVWMVPTNFICWHSSHFAPFSNLGDDAHIMVQWNKLIIYWSVVSVPCGIRV